MYITDTETGATVWQGTSEHWISFGRQREPLVEVQSCKVSFSSNSESMLDTRTGKFLFPGEEIQRPGLGWFEAETQLLDQGELLFGTGSRQTYGSLESPIDNLP